MMTYLDRKRISEMLLHVPRRGQEEPLKQLMGKLWTIEPKTAPTDLVTMNSEVVIHDFMTQEDITVRLVYHFSPNYKNQVSILSPLGTALLGMRIGKKKTYTDREGRARKILLKEILFQPEAEGRFDL